MLKSLNAVKLAHTFRRASDLWFVIFTIGGIFEHLIPYSGSWSWLDCVTPSPRRIICRTTQTNACLTGDQQQGPVLRLVSRMDVPADATTAVN